MRKNYRYIFLLIAALTVGACDKYNYTDNLQGLGKRVEWLEENAKKLNDQVEALHEIIIAIQTDECEIFCRRNLSNHLQQR